MIDKTDEKESKYENVKIKSGDLKNKSIVNI